MIDKLYRKREREGRDRKGYKLKKNVKEEKERSIIYNRMIATFYHRIPFSSSYTSKVIYV